MHSVISFKANAFGITTCGRDGTEQDVVKNLDWDGPAELFPIGLRGPGLYAPSHLYHAVIVCGLPRKGA